MKSLLGVGILVFAWTSAIAADRPIACSEPLVEASLIESSAGAIVVLTNWSGKPVHELNVTANTRLPVGSASLASGSAMAVRKQGDRSVFTFDLDVADVLILR